MRKVSGVFEIRALLLCYAA